MSEGAQDQEFIVRVPNSTEKKSYHVMKYNNSLKVDFSSWSQVRMVRENNQKFLSFNNQEDQPKFGAGSAFGKDAKEEARRKKLGIISKKYKPEDQPWLLKVGGKTGKKFKGVREGGINANTTYYLFTHGKDGVVQAYPISEWYNFNSINRYKTLDVDEAEEKWAQRGKILNKWSVMVNKKVKAGGEEGEGDDGEPEEGKKTKGGKGKDFKVSDMDEWEDNDDDFGSESDKEKEESSDDEGGKKKRGKDSKKKSKKKKGSDDDEAFEDSDDGDDEGREVDYMSDESSDSEDELLEEANIKGVDQDEGLSKMLDSDSSSDEENKDKKDDENDDKDDKKKKKDEDGEEGSGGKKKGKGKGSKNNSRAATPTEEGADKSEKAEKRKAMVANIIEGNEPASKKSKFEQFSSTPSQSSTPSGSSDTVSEETVIRYLKRRPMTTTDLVKKFRTKKTGINNAQLVPLLSSILKKINPHKQKVKGVTYLSLK